MHLVSSIHKPSAGMLPPRRAAVPQPEGLAGWLLSNWRLWQGRRRPARRHMRVLEQLPLGGRRQLLLVEIGGERFLVGGGPESVDSIVRVRPETRTGVTPITLRDRC